MKTNQPPPEWFSSKAKSEYNRLKKIRDFKDSEIDRLVEYAHTICKVQDMRELVEADGEVLISPRTGAAYTNPAYNILTGLQSRMDRLRDKLFPPPKDFKTKKETLRDVL